jgi:D-alanyl-D-alanine carboxypeptidase
LGKGKNISLENGLGNLLFIDYIFELVNKKKINLSNNVSISLDVHNISKNEKIVLESGEHVTLHKLITMAINLNSSAAILAIAEYLDPSRKLPSIKIKERRKRLGLNENVAINITGRKMNAKNQNYNMHDLLLIAKLLVQKHQNDLVSHSTILMDYKNDLYENSIFLTTNPPVICSYLFGPNNSNGFVLTSINVQRVLIAIIGARNEFHRDFLII